MKIHKYITLAVSLCLALATGAFAQNANITMWQVDFSHTGNNSNETILTPTNVGTPNNFGQLFTQPLDGQCYGQPLYVSNLTINGTAHNIVYVGTEHDSLYAFDADSNSGNNASPLWHASMIPTGSTTVPQGEVGSGDISTELGITTTPVIDLNSSTIYIVSKVKTVSARTDATGSYAAGTYQQYLHALDLTTGTEKFGGPVLINPIFSGSSNIVSNNIPERVATGLNGPTVNSNQVPFNALHEHTRAAMALNNGIVYISYASHSDTDPYHGEMIGYDATTLQLKRWFISTPNGDKGGIWGGGAGPVFDGAGNMFISTGNGNFDQNTSGATTNTDWGESVVKLSATALGQFSANFGDKGLSYFTPFNQANLGDNDLGGGGILLLPDQTGPHTHILVTGGKGSIVYVIDRDTMSFVGTTGNPAANSGYNGTSDNCMQKITESNQMFMTPGYFNGNLYYASGGGNLKQWAVGYDPVTGNYLTNQIVSNDTDGVKGSGAFISSNGLTHGVVWTCNGSLRAYNASNITNNIFSGNIPGGSTKFSLPIVANGKAYVGGQTSLVVYGLLGVATSAPAPASNLTATTASSTQINLQWIDNSNNEAIFSVQRSTTSGGTYSEVASLGPNTTTYSDTNLVPKTTYFYKIVASNSAGDAQPSNTASASTFNAYTAPGLVAYWPLDEGSGTITADVTTNGHTGTLNGESEWTTGFINSGVNFHGTGSSPSNIIVPNSPAFQFTASQSFTICAWVDPAALRNSDEAIIAKSADQGNAYGIYINSANKWVFRGPSGDVVGTPVTQGAWTHVAAVQDGVLGTRSLYVNGTLVATGAAQAANGAGDLWIGQQNQLPAVPTSYPGQIDEIRLYNIPVPPSQISSLMGPPILAATSTITQGAGTFSLPLLPSSSIAIESRAGAPQGSYKIVLNFAAAVSGLNASLTLQNGNAAVGTVGTIAYSNGNTVATVPLTGVANVQTLNLHVTGITPGNGSADVPFNILWGDVNGDSQVSLVDSNLITSKIGLTLSNANAIYDVNCDGAITSADTSVGTVGTFIGLSNLSNLALNGVATASSTESATTEPASAANDNNTSTRWTASGGTYPQWWQIDLGSVDTLSRVDINWFSNASRAYKYTIQVSSDPTFATFTTVKDNSNNTAFAPTSDPISTSSRYLRINVVGGTGFASAYEIGVFGLLGSGNVPVISNQPNSQTVTVGQQASFSVGLSSTGPVTYQWQRNGQNIYGATGSTFSIPSASSPNAGGNYTVVVTNGYGSVTSNPFSITVNPAANSSDTPTMPQWGLILMAVLLLLASQRFLSRNAGRTASA